MITSLLTVVAAGLLTATSAVLYLLPVLIGVARRVPDIGALAAVNVLLGWTLAGWVAALAMALRSARPAAPPAQIVQNFPPAVPSAALPGGGPAGPLPPRPGVPPPLVLPPRPPGPASASQAGHQ
jgi:hypothetical protein